jgi:hypothetical protein
MTALRRFWKLKIYLPVREGLPQRPSVHEFAGVLKDIAPVLNAIKSVTGVGSVGNYDNVQEIAFGFEGYRARAGALPQLGAIGESVLVRNAALVTYLDQNCGDGVLQELVTRIAAAHPWEHPVIEITDCLLYVPPAT